MQSQSKEFTNLLNNVILPHVKQYLEESEGVEHYQYEISFFREVLTQAKLIQDIPVKYNKEDKHSKNQKAVFDIIPYSDLPFQEDRTQSFSPMLRVYQYENIIFFSVITPFFEVSPYQFIITKKGDMGKLVTLHQEEEKATEERVKIVGDRHLSLEREVIDFLTNQELHEFCKEKSIRIKKGICLQGEPGNGKTLSLRYIKKRCKEEKIFFRQFVSAKDFVDNIDEFERHEKAVFVFEDFDSFAMEREKDSGPNQILGYLLNTLDGVNLIDNVVSIFTTNHIENIDSAMLRNGRIEKVFIYDNPSEQEILELFQNYVPNYESYFNHILGVFKAQPKFKPGFAHIKGICDTINLDHYYNGMKTLTEEQITRIVKDSISQKAKLMKEVSKVGF